MITPKNDSPTTKKGQNLPLSRAKATSRSKNAERILIQIIPLLYRKPFHRYVFLAIFVKSKIMTV